MIINPSSPEDSFVLKVRDKELKSENSFVPKVKNKNLKPLWLTLVLRETQFIQKTMSTSAIILLGTHDSENSYELRVNGKSISMRKRRNSHGRLSYDVAIPFVKREVFSTFPYIINEYTALIEIINPFSSDKYELSLPEKSDISSVINLQKFMKGLIRGTLYIDVGEQENQIRIRVLKGQGAIVNAARFYLPVLGMWAGASMVAHSFNDVDNLFSGLLAIVVTLTIAYPQLVRDEDVGELVLFTFTIICLLLTMLESDYGTIFQFAPLLSLLPTITSYIIRKNWMRYMRTKHCKRIKRLKKESKVYKHLNETVSLNSLIPLSEELKLRDMEVKCNWIKNIPDSEITDIFPSYGSNIEDDNLTKLEDFEDY